MGRCLAIALLGLGSLTLSCNRSTTTAHQLLASSPVTASIAIDNSSDPSDLSPLAGLEARFERLAQTLAPTVVAVSASSQVFDSDDLLRTEDLNPDKLDGLLDRTTRMVGTGLIIDAEGYILTNEHVVGDANNVWVTLDSGKVYPALVVGTDPRSDLAVIKIPAGGLQPVRFAPNAALRRGQWAIALGNPYGLATAGNQAMSVGVISALDRSLPKLSRKENRLYSGLIQTTTPINPGNSGGPLFNIDGQVIGINTAVILPEKKTNGIGFAIPITQQMLSNIDALKEGREVNYAYLGVTVSTPTERERRTAGAEPDEGVRVDSVDKDSPATSILRDNDLVTRIDGTTVRDSEQFVRVIGGVPTDRATRLTLMRDGRQTTCSVFLRKRNLAPSAITRDTRRFRWEGLLLGPIPQNWPAKNGPRPKEGLVVLAVSKSSRFVKEKSQIQEGDVILSIAGKVLADVTDLQKVLNDLPPDKRALDQIKLAADKPVAASQ
jgi:serine protease Do